MSHCRWLANRNNTKPPGQRNSKYNVTIFILIEDGHGGTAGAGRPSPYCVVMYLVGATACAWNNGHDMAKPGCRNSLTKPCWIQLRGGDGGRGGGEGWCMGDIAPNL